MIDFCPLMLTYSNSNEPNQPLALEDSGSNSDTTGLVLKNLSINIAPGEKVAICGRSGR